MATTPTKFSLFKRSNSFYYVVYDQNGRRRWKSTGVTTRPEALRALTEFRSLLENRQRKVSYIQFCDEFISYAVMQNASRTVALFRIVLRGFSLVVRNVQLRDITSQHIDRYKAKRLNEIKPVSVNVELRMLKSAFATAFRWKLIDENPCKGVPFAHVPEEAPLYLAPKEFEKLIQTISETWFREVVVFAVLTGMRRAEIANLRWQDVDLDRGVVHIQSFVRFKTKHGRRRTIPLHLTALELLRTKEGKLSGEYVFTLNSRPISCDWISHLFKRYIRRADFVNDHLHFHSLRHSYASWLVQGGATLYEVQRLLGHSSPKVTESYSHLQPEQLHNTVNKIVISMN